jgi:hypothetical protein
MKYQMLTKPWAHNHLSSMFGHIKKGGKVKKQMILWEGILLKSNLNEDPHMELQRH